MFELIRSSFILINQDKAVLYPAMIASLILSWINVITPEQTKSINMLGYLVASWLINLYIQLFTTEIGEKLLNKAQPQIGQSLSLSFRRFTPALFWTSSLAVITVVAFLVSRNNTILTLVLFPLLLLASTLLQLFPIAYVASGLSSRKIYPLLLSILRERFRSFLQIFSWIILLSFVFLLLSSSLLILPKQLAGSAQALAHGYFNVFLTYTLLLLWHSGLSKIKVLV